MDASSQLVLLGNGAVCSSFALRWKKTSFPVVVKRIHPYLHAHSKDDAMTVDAMKIDWESGCESYEYVKSFLLDYCVAHDLHYHGFLQDYAVQSDALQYSVDDVSGSEACEI